MVSWDPTLDTAAGVCKKNLPSPAPRRDWAGPGQVLQEEIFGTGAEKRLELTHL